MRKLAFVVAVCSLFLFGVANLASAQQADVAIGFGTLMSPGAASCNSVSGCPEKGGLYPTISADVIFHRRYGFDYDITWRGGQGIYGGCFNCQPYRPIINTFNAIFQPRFGNKIGADLLGGIGFQDTRYYNYNSYSSGCIYFGACFNSSFHLVADVGGGIRYYVWHHAFVRPEVRYYWVHNNTNDFSSNNILRVGASIGYTIGGPE